MKAGRIVLGVAGSAGVAYGVVLLLGLGPEQVVSVLFWVLGGIVVHDGFVAPLVVALGVAAAVRAPKRLRGPLMWVLVILGPLTLIAVPVLGRFGAKPDNTTLLDRPYWFGYALIAAVVVAIAVVASRRQRAHPVGGGADPTVTGRQGA